jgi:spore germination protein YaaH
MSDETPFTVDEPIVDPLPVGEPLIVDPTPVGEPLLIVDPTPVGIGRQRSPRRAALLGALGVGLLALAGVGFVVSRPNDTAAPPPKPAIPLDAWVPYWTLDASTAVASERLGSMRTVSPFWFNATGVDAITVDPNADLAATETFMVEADRAGVAVVPSIVDALPAGEMAAILADPQTRAQHVAAIVTFAKDGSYDGIDLDYERFAFADGKDTWAATRPNWVAFVEELSVALDADGRTLTVSIPPVYDAGQTDDSGYWVYDYAAIAPHVEQIRVMAYDFSVGEPGPIAPLQFVQRAINGALEATGAPEKIVLGVPVYGRNWPIGVTGTCPADAVLEETVSVNNRNVDELIALRSATPVFDVVTGEWSFDYELQFGDGATQCTQQRRVHYVDSDGVKLRMDLARESGLGGAALWAFGFDDPAVWDAILPTTAVNEPQTTLPE